MLQQPITNSLETREKIDNISKIIQVITKNQRDIIELKNSITKIKAHWKDFMVECR